MDAQLLSPFIITISLIFLMLSEYHAEDNEQSIYTECAQAFQCGENKYDFNFPFWGGNRPSRCGLSGFELSCQNQDITTIDIGSERPFRVLYINESAQEIRIARDYPISFCPSELLKDSKLNEDYFYYNLTSTEDLHLFYNCPNSSQVVLPKSIDSIRNSKNRTCRGDWIPNSRVFGNGSFSKAQIRNLESCKTKIRVLVNVTTLQEFRYTGNMSLQQVLNENFLIYYKIIYDEKACSACVKSGGLCWSGTYLSPPTCLCRHGVSPGQCRQRGKSNLGLKMSIGIGAAASAMLLMCFIYCLRKYLSNNLVTFGKTKSDKDVEAFIRQYGFLTPKRYKYSTLTSITNSFKHELGKGGYGNVYKGKLPDGRVVAVKVLNVSKGKGEEFINEVASIGRTSHVNVVTLLGFCYEGKRRALIYEFMPNGSLEKFIYGKVSSMGGQHLGWENLYSIALGIARGLEYLHQGCNTRIVHFDIKPHNILLDQDFCPKISDFGLAKLYTRKESILSMMEARGTIGYIAPELFSRNFGEVSHKSDVYSYGMMILEMVGGRKNVDAGAIHTSEIYFPHWIYKHIELNKELSLVTAVTVEENEIARKMIIVGLWCIQTDPSQRPSISKVIEMLEGSIAALKIPPKPYLCSPRSTSNCSPQSLSSSTPRS